MSRTAVLSVLLAVAGLAAACGSSSGPASSTSATSSTSPSTTGGSATPKSAPPVANATDTSKAPVISAGTPSPPTQLVVVDLVKGTGAEAGPSSTVRVHYVGANYADGKVFDSSWERGQPVDFPLSGVIKGFSQAIVGMKVGGRREVVIPPGLGYGAQGSPPAVGPNETLVFVIDLLKVS